MTHDEDLRFPFSNVGVALLVQAVRPWTCRWRQSVSVMLWRRNLISYRASAGCCVSVCSVCSCPAVFTAADSITNFFWVFPSVVSVSQSLVRLQQASVLGIDPPGLWICAALSLHLLQIKQNRCETCAKHLCWFCFKHINKRFHPKSPSLFLYCEKLWNINQCWTVFIRITL